MSSGNFGLSYLLSEDLDKQRYLYWRRLVSRFKHRTFLLKLRDGNYYTEIYGREVAVNPIPVKQYLVIEPKGKKKLSLEGIMAQFRNLPQLKAKAYAIHIANPQIYRDEKSKAYLVTEVRLFKFNPNKHIRVRKR